VVKHPVPDVSFHPTIVLDQVLVPMGSQGYRPWRKLADRSMPPEYYAAFRGDLRHGWWQTNERKNRRGSEKRGVSRIALTLLVNYWDRRPSPPNCQDYDGTIYRSIKDEV